jgi:hypothetical protein
MKQRPHVSVIQRYDHKVSRRSFLARASATAGGVMLEASLAVAPATAETKTATVGPDAVPLAFKINGMMRRKFRSRVQGHVHRIGELGCAAQEYCSSGGAYRFRAII